jgi:hypothetical protein
VDPNVRTLLGLLVAFLLVAAYAGVAVLHGRPTWKAAICIGLGGFIATTFLLEE